MTSFNHYALGSIINWLHKTVAGVSPLEPGWRKILIHPLPGGTVTSAEAVYDTPYDRLECRCCAAQFDGEGDPSIWSIEDGKR
ncbi:hypothetical protein TSTA_016790 [Talaromyces stipitatus ATCC 10500]|uniref:Alpha-L-rhamnosidase C-terminal domain-containing protein n=1 Tax=Talaromyces stipitatus (strain ATCC 10500 / CBS 375.48 / QM 6759 / NRRL 1006) TaxID=441959 RepID=B8MEH7_TALSN|nr:uncharacterized protein TSTA_016790 [Talaromyces stipitatus ATCC 10500]EED16604.1 hypothetical protein TSTA_016790 [Talaromyces stipitatus ATCC 10500]